ncbi:MAG: 5-formyltetrahydrofolate cyclo-ligase [Bacillota bacterium]
MTRDELRRQSRDARRALIPDVRRAAAVAAAHLLAATPLYQDARRIAVYIAVDGELDPEPLVQNARAAGKEIYLPVLPPATAGVMSFRPYAPGAALKPNRFQIPEPVAGDPLPPADLDIVLTPLVAFDLEGNRLGMGAGYYDKTFAFLKRVQRVHPALVGFAYECQLAPEVPAEVWDVPLSAVVTEQHFYAVAHD